ncbi:uncharacterized protein LOC142345892 [Convolutriloba macropyga]|uniref:uncharacterized protein LOC142345892 n=1 Tax=Convolutriloba macropyga TaxID=536237 RepID=UPI003F5204E1
MCCQFNEAFEGRAMINKGQIVLMVMVLFTILALPMILLGNCTAILNYTPSTRPVDVKGSVHVKSGLWVMEGCVNGTIEYVKQSDPTQGLFHGSIASQLKPFLSNKQFQDPRPWLSCGAAMNILTAIVVLVLLVLEVTIYGGMCGPTYHRRNRILIVVFSSISLGFGLMMGFTLFMITYNDLGLWSSLHRRNNITPADFNYGWFLIAISNNGQRPSVVHNGSFTLDYAFVTPVIGLAFIGVVFGLSFGFAVAAKSDCKQVRHMESKNKIDKEKQGLINKNSTDSNEKKKSSIVAEEKKESAKGIEKQSEGKENASVPDKVVQQNSAGETAAADTPEKRKSSALTYQSNSVIREKDTTVASVKEATEPK